MTSQKTFSHYIIDRSYKEGGWMKVHHKRKVENMSSNGWVSQTFILEIINYRTLPHTHKSFRKSMRKKWKFYKKKKIQNTSIHIFYRQLLLISTQINVVNISEEILRLVVCRQFSKLLGF